MVYETKYFGIDLQSEIMDGVAVWWITGGRNGEEEYFGPVKPNEQDVERYRNALR